MLTPHTGHTSHQLMQPRPARSRTTTGVHHRVSKSHINPTQVSSEKHVWDGLWVLGLARATSRWVIEEFIMHMDHARGRCPNKIDSIASQCQYFHMWTCAQSPTCHLASQIACCEAIRVRLVLLGYVVMPISTSCTACAA